MNKTVRKLIRHYCPNIPVIRRWMTGEKLKEIRGRFMGKEQVLTCEKNPEKTGQAIQEFEASHPKYALKIREDFKTYVNRIADPKKRAHMESLETDVLFCCYAYGFAPDEYFVFELEHKSIDARKSYMSNQDVYLMVYQMNDIIDVDVFFDKYRTYEKYKKYYKRDAVCIERPKDKQAFLEFVDRHPVFVQKDVALSKGNSVTLVDIRDVGGLEPGDYFDSIISRGKHIVEERVVQSDVMAKLNASSVNTVRCITFLVNGEVKIGPCFLKVGQGGSFVDNGGAGGILVGIDSQTGKLSTSGYNEFLTEYTEHPDTGTVFMGYQLPEWDQMLVLAKELSAKMPAVRYIGWDLAHTDQGWVVIEGNGSGQMIGPQIVFRRGFKEDIRAWLKGE